MSDDTRATLDRLLSERILILDGAMGTMIQRHPLEEAGLPRRALRGTPAAPEGQQRHPRPDAAGHHLGDPPRLPRGRRRHHRDQHVQRDVDRPGRLRHRAAGPRAERRRGAPGPRRPADEWTARTPTSRASSPARSGRPTARSRSLPTSRTRLRAVTFEELRGGLRRAGARAGRGRRRPAADRDDLRHARTPRPRIVAMDDVARGDRRAPAPDDLGDDHRPQRPHALRADDRGVLEHDRARPPVQRRGQLRARRGRDAALPRGALAASPPAGPAATRTPACRTPSASTTRAPTRRPACCASSPRAAWSTSSAVAAAPPPTTSARSRRRSRASRRARSPRRSRSPASRASSR